MSEWAYCSEKKNELVTSEMKIRNLVRGNDDSDRFELYWDLRLTDGDYFRTGCTAKVDARLCLNEDEVRTVMATMKEWCDKREQERQRRKDGGW